MDTFVSLAFGIAHGTTATRLCACSRSTQGDLQGLERPCTQTTTYAFRDWASATRSVLEPLHPDSSRTSPELTAWSTGEVRASEPLQNSTCVCGESRESHIQKGERLTWPAVPPGIGAGFSRLWGTLAVAFAVARPWSTLLARMGGLARLVVLCFFPT